MHRTSLFLLVSIALSAPALAEAQAAPPSPVTRAEVRGQLVRLESVGYRPARNDVHYPDSLQAAEAKLDAATSGVGGTGAARAEAGTSTRVASAGNASLYAHH